MTTGVLCEQQDVLDRVGVGSWLTTATAASSVIIDRHIVIAESIVVAETRIDYRASSASLQADVLRLVKSCVATQAAITIINNDMRGYSSQAQATTTLNVNIREYNKNIKALKDLDTNIIRSLST